MAYSGKIVTGNILFESFVKTEGPTLVHIECKEKILLPYFYLIKMANCKVVYAVSTNNFPEGTAFEFDACSPLVIC